MHQSNDLIPNATAQNTKQCFYCYKLHIMLIVQSFKCWTPTPIP